MGLFNFYAIPYNEHEVSDDRFKRRAFEAPTIELAEVAAYEYFDSVALPHVVRSVHRSIGILSLDPAVRRQSIEDIKRLRDALPRRPAQRSTATSPLDVAFTSIVERTSDLSETFFPTVASSTT